MKFTLIHNFKIMNLPTFFVTDRAHLVLLYNTYYHSDDYKEIEWSTFIWYDRLKSVTFLIVFSSYFASNNLDKTINSFCVLKNIGMRPDNNEELN